MHVLSISYYLIFTHTNSKYRGKTLSLTVFLLKGMIFTQYVPYISLLRKEFKAFLLFSISLFLWLRDLLHFRMKLIMEKASRVILQKKWKSASKRLHCLQRSIIKQNKKAEDIFRNALYAMLCCVKEVKIYEVFQSAN